MFKKPTVFVLGAGASFECGLPLGKTLATRIEASLDPATKSSDQLLPYLFDSGFISENRAEYEIAAEQLRKTLKSSPSTDDALNWLSGNPFAVKLGKVGIVSEIMFAERESALCRAPDNPAEFANYDSTWLYQFFSMAKRDAKRESLDDIFRHVTIINFNYDRCVEQYLYEAFQQRAAIDAADAEKVVKSLKIIRPYGFLGGLWGEPGLPYGADRFDPVAAAERILTLTEQRANDLDQKMKDAILASRVIVFLGFGFHTQNIAALTVESEMKPRSIFATLTGFQLQVTGQIKEFIGRAVKTEPSFVQGQIWKAHELLVNYESPILRAAE